MRTIGRFARKYHGRPRRGSTNEIRRERVVRGGNRERGEAERRENATSFRPSAAGPRELFRPLPPPFTPFPLPSSLAVQVYLGLINAYTHTRDPIGGGAMGAEGNANCRYDFFNADFRPE